MNPNAESIYNYESERRMPEASEKSLAREHRQMVCHRPSFYS